jgi:hypothetical protein
MVDRAHQTFFDEVNIEYLSGNQKLQEYEIFAKHLNKTDDETGLQALNLAVKFELERYSSPFILKYHLPCCCLVLISLMSYFIPPNAIPGRIALLVTVFLVLNNIFNNHQVKSEYFFKDMCFISIYYFRLKHQCQKGLQHLAFTS